MVEQYYRLHCQDTDRYLYVSEEGNLEGKRGSVLNLASARGRSNNKRTLMREMIERYCRLRCQDTDRYVCVSEEGDLALCADKTAPTSLRRS